MAGSRTKDTQQTEHCKLLLLFCLFEAESRPSATVAAAAAAAGGMAADLPSRWFYVKTIHIRLP